MMKKIKKFILSQNAGDWDGNDRAAEFTCPNGSEGQIRLQDNKIVETIDGEETIHDSFESLMDEWLAGSENLT